jgi:CRISPR type I-F-associated protein Csy2
MDLDPRRIREIDDLGDTLRRLPPGHVLLDRSDLLEAATGEATDPLDGLLDVFTWHRDPEGGFTNRFARDAEGRPRYLVPLAVGYQAIEPIKATRTRRGTRSSQTPHVFAEGIASVGELVSSRKLARDASAAQSRDMFWSWEVDRSVGTIRVQGRSLQTA